MQRLKARGSHTLAALAAPAALAALAALATLAPAAARAGATVLYAFTGGTDGGTPEAGLIADKAGDLLGTTYAGGAGGVGTVFKLAPDGTETVLHAFRGPDHGDGSYPWGGVTEDKKGNLYGTTTGGGAQSSGTVFKLAPDGHETVLYSFEGRYGAYPMAGVIEDKFGNLYGTASTGGTGCGTGCGVVFEISRLGAETVLHRFKGGRDGAYPFAGLVEDAATGILYGTTTAGGGKGCSDLEQVGCGTVYEIDPSGAEQVVHAFRERAGAYPAAGLIVDKSGNLYGTTKAGGTYGKGTVFEIAPGGDETVLYSFAGGSDGAYPWASLIRDRAGNLYGTTYQGGGSGCYRSEGCGTIFRIAPDGSEKILYDFRVRKNAYAANPRAGLIEDQAGTFYGTTEEGGYGCNGNGCGTVFSLGN